MVDVTDVCAAEADTPKSEQTGATDWVEVIVREADSAAAGNRGFAAMASMTMVETLDSGPAPAGSTVREHDSVADRLRPVVLW